MSIQQLTFIKRTKEEELEIEVARLREQCDKIRKGQFAKIGALTKAYNDLVQRMDIYDAMICKKESFR